MSQGFCQWWCDQYFSISSHIFLTPSSRPLQLGQCEFSSLGRRSVVQLRHWPGAISFQIGTHAPFWFCINTAPRLTGLASATTLVDAFLLKYANVPASAMLCLSDSKEAFCSGPKWNGTSFLVSFLNGSVRVAKWGINLLL